MKNVITLSRTLSLSVLILVFAAASATEIKEDDTTKCKKNCCKRTVINKDVEEALKAVTIELKNFDAVKLKTDITQALAIAPVKLIRNGNRILVIEVTEPVEETKTPQSIDFKNINKEMNDVQENMSQLDVIDQKVDFKNLNKEMNNSQENMTQMDPSLKKDDAKTRKAADELLKTGIKS